MSCKLAPCALLLEGVLKWFAACSRSEFHDVWIYRAWITTAQLTWLRLRDSDGRRGLHWPYRHSNRSCKLIWESTLKPRKSSVCLCSPT